MRACQRCCGPRSATRRASARTTQPAANLRRSKRWFGIGYNFAILMAVTVLVLSVIAWRTNETADGA